MAKIARNPALKRTHLSRAKQMQGCVDRIRGMLAVRSRQNNSPGCPTPAS